MTTQARSANAQEVIHDIDDVTIDAMDLLFNLVSGETSIPTMQTGNSSDADFRIGFIDTGFGYIAGPAHGTMPSFTTGFVDPGGFGTAFAYPVNLMEGVLVSSQTFGGQTSFASYGNFGYLSNFQTSGGDGRGFVGIRFTIGGAVHFGWAEVTGLGSDSAILHAFGYNATPGAGSITGGGAAVPEPSSAILLALGAAGLATWRRRRKTA